MKIEQIKPNMWAIISDDGDVLVERRTEALARAELEALNQALNTTPDRPAAEETE